MRACVIHKYIILIYEVLPEIGIKTDSKKVQGSRKSQENIDLDCLFEVGSICRKYMESVPVLRHTLCQRIVR